MNQILGLLGMYIDAVVVEVMIFFFTFIQIGSGHTVSARHACCIVYIYSYVV